MKENVPRADDARTQLRAAAEEGVVASGGTGRVS